MSIKGPVYDQASLNPTRKVAAGLMAGAAVTIIAWAVEAYGTVAMPMYVQGALQTIAVFGVQWLVRDRLP